MNVRHYTSRCMRIGRVLQKIRLDLLTSRRTIVCPKRACLSVRATRLDLLVGYLGASVSVGEGHRVANDAGRIADVSLDREGVRRLRPLPNLPTNAALTGDVIRDHARCVLE